MVYSLYYRRPSHVLSSQSSQPSLSSSQKEKSIKESITSGSLGMSAGIPEALSFDRIISGGVCPPCTIRDFMNYLLYIEHAAENLQFFLWFKDYQIRWERLPENEKKLAPAWSAEQAETEIASNSVRPRRVNPTVAALLKDTDFADGASKSRHEKINPFDTKDSLILDESRYGVSEYGMATSDDKTRVGSNIHSVKAEQAFDEAGLKWKPFTIMPYRDEVDRIISIYLNVGGPRELNISDAERQAAMHALQQTTHPSAFKSVSTSIEYSLRKQSHPNFIRWTICNGNRPRVVFARGLGVFCVAAGLIADLLVTLSHASRPWRVFPVILIYVGIATLIAAWKGMCVVLHGLHHRHLRPWELFSDEPDDMIDGKRVSQDTLVSDSRNSFEDAPWIAQYDKRNIIRKVFDRQIWIQEPALRQIQDTIFLQAILAAFVLSAVCVGIYCAVPRGNFY